MAHNLALDRFSIPPPHHQLSGSEDRADYSDMASGRSDTTSSLSGHRCSPPNSFDLLEISNSPIGAESGGNTQEEKCVSDTILVKETSKYSCYECFSPDY